MSPPAGCRIATGSRNEFLTDIAPEETLVLKGEEECGEFKSHSKKQSCRPSEGGHCEGGGGGSGLLCVYQQGPRGPGGEALPPHLTGGKLG